MLRNRLERLQSESAWARTPPGSGDAAEGPG
jgi:hypothetical protein